MVSVVEVLVVIQYSTGILVVRMWVHKKCSGIKGSMSKVKKSFICRDCLNSVTSTGHTSVDIGASANLELVDKFCYLGDMLSVDGDADAAVEARIRHTQPFYGSMDFVRDNAGELVPEETFTHSHLSWSSIVPYLLSSIYYDPRHPPCSIHVPDSLFPQSLSKFSFSWLGTLHFILHTFLHPIMVFFSQHMPIPLQPV